MIIPIAVIAGVVIVVSGIAGLPFGGKARQHRTQLVLHVRVLHHVLEQLVPHRLIEMRLDKDGNGEGRMAVGTKISKSKDGKTVELR